MGVYPFTCTRDIGGRWRLRGVTDFLDVRILDCCFGLCGAGARQRSNSIEERMNPAVSAAGIGQNIFDFGDGEPHKVEP